MIQEITVMDIFRNAFGKNTYGLVDLAFVCLDFDGELVDETGKLGYLAAIVLGLGDNFLVLAFIFAHVGGGLTETSLLGFKFSLQVTDLQHKLCFKTDVPDQSGHI